ncbi:MAG: glycosyltransferase [Gammaproteobacteria bacterium]|nr:glycosyltransferase [Gammaproteobacteria bacterium]
MTMTAPPLYDRAKDSLVPMLFWLFVAGAILISLPRYAWDYKSHAIVALGLIGIWRYSWYLINQLRGTYFERIHFPALRREMEKIRASHPQRLYVMVMSYREDPDISARVFRALTQELLRLPSQSMIVVSVGAEAEAVRIRSVVNMVAGSERLTLHFLQQSQGKRIAMGHALRRIARDFNDPATWNPAAERDLVVFMDGDSLITPGAVRRTAGFFRLNARLGGLTTNEDAEVLNGSLLATEWYKLRFARRHAMMKSHALSGKVLTLTGRFSVFRAPLVLSENFIRGVEADHLNHWLFGKFRFLMGDDKSTWFHLLSDGWNMLYVPDVMVYSLESRTNSFFKLTIPLIFRWNGNMLRNNARALALGPARTGRFIWLAILDQRISMWTTFVGPMSAVFLAIAQSWVYLVFYLVWVIITRLAQLAVLITQGKTLTVVDLPLQIFDQWIGSAVKIYASFNLAQQSWSKTTKQSAASTAPKTAVALMPNYWIARALMIFHLTLLFTLLALGTGLLKFPNLRLL